MFGINSMPLEAAQSCYFVTQCHQSTNMAAVRACEVGQHLYCSKYLQTVYEFRACFFRS
jgi:hypothetical protein